MAEEPKKQDDDVVGKVYDSRLMRRLVRYLAPYKLQVALSGVAIVLKAGSDVLGPYFVKVAVDNYFAPTPGKHSWLAAHLSPVPTTGVTELGLLYLASLSLIFALEFIQTYMMQWTGQKIMFDLRSQIFRHIQSMSVAFFDRNPVGRLVTRVTSDVDALNEMFTSGVLAIFEDIFILAFIIVIMVQMSWLLALLTLSVVPLILYATKLFRDHVRDSYRRQRAATAKINAFTQEYVSGMSVVQLFNRERRAFRDFSDVNSENKLAWTDAIFAYALYYPVVELLSSIAIALVIWRGGLMVLHSMNLGGPFIAQSHRAMSGVALHPVVTLGILIAFIQYAQRFFRPIQDLSDKYNILQAAMAASERVFKLLDTQPDIQSPALPTPTNHSGRIEFRDVWFTYQHLTPEQLSALSALGNPQTLSSRPEAAHFADSTLSSRPEAAHFADSTLSSRPEAAHFADSTLSSRPEAAHFADSTLSSRPEAAHFADSTLSSRPEAAHFADAVERPLYSPLAGPATTRVPQGFSLGSHTAQEKEGVLTPDPLANIEWILRGVSFTIEPNATAAIVGHTGAGKTTITALMMRFYDVQRGQVLIDGVDVRDQDLNALRKRFGVVLQDPFLFSGTIAQNIRLGTDTITDAEVANAAEEVNVADFIRTLPAQFDEPVLERGSTLSTGQKQLISFARALAHRPGILILDEATSSVDTETEFRVRLALERMITGRTSVLIAHRLSTIQRADVILVMHKGQLREFGSHQQLLALRGLYFKLYQLQYKDQELAEPLSA